MDLIDLCDASDAKEPVLKKEELVRICLVPSGLGPKRRDILCNGIRRLGGEVVEDCHKSTHIVAAESITLDRINASLGSCGNPSLSLIVSCRWVVESLIKNHWLSAHDFLVEGAQTKRARIDHEVVCHAPSLPAPFASQSSQSSLGSIESKDAAQLIERLVARTDCTPAGPSKSASVEPKVTNVEVQTSSGKASGKQTTCLNSELLREFESMHAHYSTKRNEKWREMQYRKIVAALRCLPFRICTMEDLKRPEAAALNGSHTRTRIQEFLEQGSVQLARCLKSDPKSVAVNELINFGMTVGKSKYASYVGSSTAERWYTSGITSVQALADRIREDSHFLTPNQKVMWDFRESFSQRIPRHEVELIAEVVRLEFPPFANVEPCGSYRRGALDCGDVDLLVCVPGDAEYACRHALERLTNSGFITSTLKGNRGGASESGHWQGGCCLACSGRPGFLEYKTHRRLDVKVYPIKERSFAQMYFGSGESFNRAIRLFATRKGFSLNDRGIRKVTRGRNDQGEQVTLWEGPFEEDPSGESWATEASIFAFLGLPFIPPTERAEDITIAHLEKCASSSYSDDISMMEVCTNVSLEAEQSTWRSWGVVALDCEFVGVGRNTIGIGGDRNALGRVSVVSYAGEVLLDTFVRVEEPVVDFRIHVTGLTQRHLNAGIDVNEARARVRNLIDGRIIVGHSLTHDLKVLSLCPPPELVRDTHACKHLKVPNCGRSLKALYEHHLGKPIQEGAHCSVEDARAALSLYKIIENTWDAECPFACKKEPPTPSHSQLCQAAAALQGEERGENDELASMLERRASTAVAYARDHYLRVSRTLRALPFTVRSLCDLDRPELRCVGNGKIRSILEADIACRQRADASNSESVLTIDIDG